MYLGIDVAFVRIGFALAAFFTKGAGFIAYVVMALPSSWVLKSKVVR